MIRVLLHKLLNFNVEDTSTMKTALNDLNYYILKYPKYKKLNTILAGGWNYKRMSPNEAVAQITRLQKFVKDVSFIRVIIPYHLLSSSFIICILLYIYMASLCVSTGFNYYVQPFTLYISFSKMETRVLLKDLC